MSVSFMNCRLYNWFQCMAYNILRLHEATPMSCQIILLSVTVLLKCQRMCAGCCQILYVALEFVDGAYENMSLLGRK